ncbi:MAG: hypothetical protein ACLPYS_18425 [Vulcanimicrobiaceae bacterium]
MLRYYLAATFLVVGALAVGAAFYRSGKPLELAAVQATGSPSAPRYQAPSLRAPAPVIGDAPWALSAFPACFTELARERGPRAFVQARLPAGLLPLPSGTTVRSGDCSVLVGDGDLRLVRGEERLHVAGARLFQAAGPPFGLAGRRELALLRDAGGWWELRRYRTAAGARILP